MRVRPEVRDHLVRNRESLVREVLKAAGHLRTGPLQRTVVGCAKVLGDRFGRVTRDELYVAVMVVQFQCALSMKKYKTSDSA